jgi:hypothetical protein
LGIGLRVGIEIQNLRIKGKTQVREPNANLGHPALHIHRANIIWGEEEVVVCGWRNRWGEFDWGLG